MHTICGICGIVDQRGVTPEPEQIQAMLPPLASRGPDHEAWLTEPGMAFGHRRLSIIDLSANGNQPMTDPELDLTVVHNGEIYNYKELKNELSAKGYRFASDSDTEVILKAYHAWGDDCVRRFFGMFAFCIYDRPRGRFLLARDRLGIKPLYYTVRRGCFYFASNIQALVAAGVVDGDLCPEALHHYLSFHAVVPAPLTIFKGVSKLEPGRVLTLERDGRQQIRPYWQVAFEPVAGRSEDEWVEAVLAALRTSVRRRLVADVPVGALLSGGVDSSVIVALMAAENPYELHTYSIGFEDVADEAGNEFVYSDLIAQQFGTRHHKIFVDSRRLLPALSRCVAAMAEPMVSHDAIGFYLLSAEVSKTSKVVLSGQGADEVFGGYHWYPRIAAENGDPVARYRRHFCDRTHAEIEQALAPEYHCGDVAGEFIRRHFARPGAPGALEKALRLDTTVMLIDDPVKRVDNMTMAWGLEARVPFLDHELVELAASIPSELKVAGDGKHILKKAAERLVPHKVIYRPKGYFPVPALKYLRGEYLDLARDVLGSRAARERGLFRRRHVEALLADPEAHMTPLGGSKLWQLTLLEMWLQQLGV